MKLLLTMILLFICNSCTIGPTTAYLGNSLDVHSRDRNFPLGRMLSLEGGITNDNKFIINKMSPPKNHILTANGKPLIEGSIQKLDGQYIFSDKVKGEIVRPIAIYTKDQMPQENEEYLKIIKVQKESLQMKYRDPEQNIHLLNISLNYRKKPHYMKSTAYTIIYPFVFVVDAVIATAFGRCVVPEKKRK
ncbi:hypothetical protein PQO03_15425 [Lentisphaera profundi]|uniref:Uncharacterized protein n=1 Tax=Lentisphaera profundi TaxID=1658616 RepID=A0ABY7VYH4_9BACT|nr:hypothetical protein [Lentisphaera profundi]WDE99225.1 hypothetical protein PQO03_15425 [Lentisphaera profundi]